MNIDDKTKEMIAIGASITANCQPCLQYHVTEARRFGADAQEIADAIAVGKQVRRGAGAKMDAFSATMAGETASSKSENACCR
jgi:AhpD family alkylhydroperoxidase